MKGWIGAPSLTPRSCGNGRTAMHWLEEEKKRHHEELGRLETRIRRLAMGWLFCVLSCLTTLCVMGAHGLLH